LYTSSPNSISGARRVISAVLLGSPLASDALN
jgi:hypothetical protein